MDQLQPRCKCGQAIEFAPGQTKSRCPVSGCGMPWECGPEGYWALGLFTISFTPIFAAATKRRFNHYEKYMRWRNKNKERRVLP